MINEYGHDVLDLSGITNLLYCNPELNISGMNIDESNEIELYNKAIQTLYLEHDFLSSYIPPNMSVEEFDRQNQQNWHMPDEYKEMDIAKYILDLCDNDQVKLQRVGYELLKFQELDLFNVLKFLKYLVDTLRKNNIVWGVGRGSSTASYSLYLLGVHKIDSIKYDLPFEDFVKI